MIRPIFQTLALLLAAYGLWRLWRLFDDQPRTIRYVAGAGLIIRGLAGSFFFWVSYLELNLARSLQLGDGIWFFALDGAGYISAARKAASQGLLAIAAISSTSPAVVYTRTLAGFSWLFGDSSAIALLLNILAYMLTVLVICRWAQLRRLERTFTLIPVVAVTFLPSWILWSIQPLKDVFFCLLVVLFVFALDRVALTWRSHPDSFIRSVAGEMALFLGAVYALAGIRWYYATLALGMAVITYVWLLPSARGKKQFVVATAVSFAVVIAGTQMIIFGAGPYLPKPVLHVFRPISNAASLRAAVTAPVKMLPAFRHSFDSAKNAGTQIETGPLLAKSLEDNVDGSGTSASQVPKDVSNLNPETSQRTGPTIESEQEPYSVAVMTRQDEATEKDQRERGIPAPDRIDSRIAAKIESSTGGPAILESGSVEPQASNLTSVALQQRSDPQVAPQQPAPTQQSESTNAVGGRQSTVLESDPARNEGDGGRQTFNGENRREARTFQKLTGIAEEAVVAPHQPRAIHRPSDRSTTPAATASGPASVARADGASPAEAAEGSDGNASAGARSSHAARLFSGMAAMFLPRSVAVSLGIISVGGGRGLWLFADLDTIFLDLILLASFASVVIALRRGAWRDPLLWFLLGISVLMSLLLAYTVSNYGTLFRHREMVAITACLLALAVGSSRRAPDAPAIEPGRVGLRARRRDEERQKAVLAP